MDCINVPEEDDAKPKKKTTRKDSAASLTITVHLPELVADQSRSQIGKVLFLFQSIVDIVKKEDMPALPSPASDAGPAGPAAAAAGIAKPKHLLS